jgi:hypothetical protein
MNERIRELAEQVDKEFNSPYDRYKAIERFAELIVRECGHCMVDIMLHGGIEPEEGYDIMLKHFGVEE